MTKPWKTGVTSSEIGSNLASNSDGEPHGEQTATSKAEIIKMNRTNELQKKQLEQMASLTTFDWTKIPPPLVAQILVNKPYKGATGEPDFYLEPWQALMFAIRSFELGLSPFSNEVWFNPKNNITNVTFEGKLKLARKNGLNLGPPHFERIPATGTQERLVNGKKVQDYAYKCTMSSGNEKAEYTAWLSEWRMGRSGVWQEKPDHMLQLRAAEKCLSFASGIGSSELMGEGDLQTGPLATEAVPEMNIQSTEFVAKEQK